MQVIPKKTKWDEGSGGRVSLQVPASMKAFASLALAALLHCILACPVQSAEPLAQDYTTVFHNLDPEYYVEGCGLVKLDDGSLLAAVPVVPRLQWTAERRAEHSVVHILRSSDAGKTWRASSDLPYYSGVPWIHDGKLYLFACTPGPKKARNDDLLLLRSNDNGKTWSAPVTLFKGHFWNCHTNMVVQDNHLYWAVDDLSFGNKRGPTVICGDLRADLMNPASWRRSATVPLPDVPNSLTDPKFAEYPNQYLEPNVTSVNGHLRVLAVLKTKHQATGNLCAVLDVTDTPEKLDLKFTQYNPMPGGHLKFFTRWDETSKMFWATSNLAVDSQGQFDWFEAASNKGVFRTDGRLGGNDRRFLMLHYSVDSLNWLPAGCVAMASRLSQSFMYAVPVIDGNDLAIIARSSVNAPNQHDADYATFHRVPNFRSLALDLVPQPEK